MKYLQNLEICNFFESRLVHIKEMVLLSKKKMRSKRRLQINGRKQQHNEKRKLKNFSWSWTRKRYRRWWGMISESNLKHSEMWVLPILTMYLPDPKLGTLKLPLLVQFVNISRHPRTWLFLHITYYL